MPASPGAGVAGAVSAGAADAAPAPVAVAAPPLPSPSPSDRLRPLAGSKTCIVRVSTQSSASWPSRMRVAASSRATTVSPLAPVSARPESLASSSSSAAFTPSSSSRVK